MTQELPGLAARAMDGSVEGSGMGRPWKSKALGAQPPYHIHLATTAEASSTQENQPTL
jgi:hypothetical protein